MSITDVRGNFIKPHGSGTRPYTNGVAVHHSVSGDYLTESSSLSDEMASLKAIEDYHLSLYGFFAYHFAVLPSGNVYQVGNIDSWRAHVAKRNHELVGIVAVGTFTNRLPGKKQMEGIREAIQFIFSVYGPRPVKGHNDWAVPGWGSQCAGKLNIHNGFNWVEFLQNSGVEDMQFVRHNRIADWFENRELPASGNDAWVMQATTDFGLPAEAKVVEFMTYLDEGEVVWYDGESLNEGGRIGNRGVMVGSASCVVVNGTINFRTEQPTKIGRVFCLGYWK